MNERSSTETESQQPEYRHRTPQHYLDRLEPEVRATLSDRQLEAVRRLLAAAVPKPVPKVVDLRFWVNLFSYRYFVVLFVGKERRTQERADPGEPMAQTGNIAVALLLLIGLNLAISLLILLLGLSIKALLGISPFAAAS